MEWPEVNCIVEALDALITKYEATLLTTDLSEDDRADVSNDLGYAVILREKYKALKDQLRPH